MLDDTVFRDVPFFSGMNLTSWLSSSSPWSYRWRSGGAAPKREFRVALVHGLLPELEGRPMSNGSGSAPESRGLPPQPLTSTLQKSTVSCIVAAVGSAR